VSDEDPPRAVDRPKLAEALASLKEGLSESADPFFDGWKRPRAEAQALDNVAAVAAPDTVEQRVVVDALDTEIGGIPGLDARTGTAPRVPPHDEQNAPTVEIARVCIAAETGDGVRPHQGGAPPEALPPGAMSAPVFVAPKRGGAASATRSASLRDTVRIRVVGYPVFPKWALVAAAALVVFALSAVALRAAYRPVPVAGIAASPALDSAGPTSSERVPPVADKPVEPTSAPSVAISAPAARTPKLAPTPAERERERAPREGADPPRDTKPHRPEFFREPGF